MHLSARAIRRHLGGHRDPGVAPHLRSCPVCAERVAVAAAAETTWERRGRLGRLVRLPDPPDATEARLGRLVEEAALDRN